MDLHPAAAIPPAIAERKGARKAGDIPAEVLDLLTHGQIESVNLTEWLAVDHLDLLAHVRTELGLQPQTDAMQDKLETVRGQAIMKIIPTIALEWLHLLRQQSKDDRNELFEHLAVHRSDSVRCWAAYIVGLDETALEDKLDRIRRFAADPHFGVREIAWMAVREPVAARLEAAIHLLEDWVQEPDANVRRFAVELTRPRGVWARHIAQLKLSPELALPLLDPVKSDSSKYVQDSVANWLNDAAKSRPDWVRQLCLDWLNASDTKETRRIAARAQRSLKP